MIEEQLRRRGDVDAAPEDAELVIVNTCSVTASADQGARQTIRRIVTRESRRQARGDRLLRDARPDEFADLPNVVRVVPNDDEGRAGRRLDGRRRIADDGGALRRRGRTLRRGARAGRRRAHGVDAARADRVRRAVQLLHHPAALAARDGRVRCPMSLRDVGARWTAGYGRSLITGVHLGSYGRDLAGRHGPRRPRDAR